MEGGEQRKAMTVEEAFNDVKHRRYGLIKALTTDLDEFRKQCDTGDEDALTLYGFPCGRWEVKTDDHVLGVEFSRYGMMQENDWLRLIAESCDVWLFYVSFLFGATFSFGKADRLRLFHLMNDLPTIREIVTGQKKDEGKVEEHLCSICGENDMFLQQYPEVVMNESGMADHFKCSCCSYSNNNSSSSN